MSFLAYNFFFHKLVNTTLTNDKFSYTDFTVFQVFFYSYESNTLPINGCI